MSILSLLIGREKREDSKSHWKQEACISVFFLLAFEFSASTYFLENFLAISQLSPMC